MIKNFDTEKTILLIDGSSFLYRAYYALKPMHTIHGQAIHAVYGFCRMIKKLLADFKPSYCVIAWDSPAKTYRAQAEIRAYAHALLKIAREHFPASIAAFEKKLQGAEQPQSEVAQLEHPKKFTQLLTNN